MLNRRQALVSALAGAPLAAQAAPQFASGIEGQRKADLGAGTGELRARNFQYRGLPA